MCVYSLIIITIISSNSMSILLNLVQKASTDRFKDVSE